MTAMQKKTNPMLPHLPDEIVFDGILTKLPVKSLYRFKCVSKLWNATISCDSYFLKSQLSWAKRISISTSSILCLYSLPPRRHIFVKKDDPKFFSFKNGEPIRLVGHCNGLFCFVSESESGFEICNPSTREFLYHPLPLQLPRTRRRKSYGFGFDQLNNQYKLVQIVHENQNVYRCMVYSLGGGTNDLWKDITVSSNLSINLNRCTLPHQSATGPAVDSGRGLHVNGKLYWFFRRAHKLLAFDAHHQSFECFDGPKVKDSSRSKFLRHANSHCFLIEVLGCVCLTFAGRTKLHQYAYNETHRDWKSITYSLPPMSCSTQEYRYAVQLLEVMCASGGQNETPSWPSSSVKEYHLMGHIENAASLKTLVWSGAGQGEHVKKRTPGQVKSVSSF